MAAQRSQFAFWNAAANGPWARFPTSRLKVAANVRNPLLNPLGLFEFLTFS